jgi:hypothetical protein
MSGLSTAEKLDFISRVGEKKLGNLPVRVKLRVKNVES